MARIKDGIVVRMCRRRLKDGDLTEQQVAAVKEILKKKRAPEFKKLMVRVRGLADFKGFGATGDKPILEWLAAHWMEILKAIIELVMGFMDPATSGKVHDAADPALDDEDAADDGDFNDGE